MFQNCQKLKTVNLSSFNTENVVNIEELFSGCHNLISLDLSSFNINKVRDMLRMFSNCKKLTDIKLGAIKPKDDTNLMLGMFYGCTNLKSIDNKQFLTIYKETVEKDVVILNSFNMKYDRDRYQFLFG